MVETLELGGRDLPLRLAVHQQLRFDGLQVRTVIVRESGEALPTVSRARTANLYCRAGLSPANLNATALVVPAFTPPR
jgi:hypothetical protein